jgi:hypothetical protein
MESQSKPDSLSWTLISFSGAVGLLSKISLSNDGFLFSILLLVPAGILAIWTIIDLVFAIRWGQILRITSCAISAFCIFLSTQWIGPGHTAVAEAGEDFRFDGQRAVYQASVANHKIVNPRRTLIVLDNDQKSEPGTLDRHVVYDETDTLFGGVSAHIVALANQQAAVDVAQFLTCSWKARRLEGHYYLVDFSCPR